MGHVQVIGSQERRFDIPGSAHLITEEEIRLQSYDDINRILRKVPGVYLREEDGYGLFPNISLRGVDTSRSAKITLMEDGVLTAPAPYAAPSAYYSPTAGRMSSLEVLKGSSQVRYGPHVTGGVL
ncbi:MAG: TonB-dependent receptor plug domain-containing protein, partial [Gammaproteobacteria bacterium]